MKHKFIFGGIDSSDYNVWLTGSNTFQAPARDVEYVSVPGRNGDLIIDNGRWQNVDLTYPANIAQDFDRNMELFRAAMGRKRGYQRLEDTYHPDEFRIATFADALTPEMIPLNRGGDFNVVFNCKPQRYLKSGEHPIQIIPPRVLGNGISTNYLPLVKGTQIRTYVHCAPEDSLTVSCVSYNSAGTEISRLVSENVTNGRFSFYAPNINADYIRLFVEGYSDLDKINIQITGLITFEGKQMKIDAHMARTWQITNPTGYISKPLFEIFNNSMASFTLKNLIDGVADSRYVWRINQLTVNHFWMDCDVQYVYDADKNNLTNYLFLSTAESAAGKGLVFPQFGEDVIGFQTYDTTPPQINNDSVNLGLIQIYPNWWRL